MSECFGGPVPQLLTRRTIDREVESSNQASDRDECRGVAKGPIPLLSNSTSSTEMRHPPALSPYAHITGNISISIMMITMHCKLHKSKVEYLKQFMSSMHSFFKFYE